MGMWNRRCGILIAACIAQAAPAMADCKADIVAILDGARKHGPSQETTVRVLVSRDNTAKTPRVVSRRGNIVRSVPLDRLHVTVMREGKAASEAITIGDRHWTRDPGKAWKAEKPIDIGVLEQSAEEFAKSISTAVCEGSATLNKRVANVFRFETSMFGIVAPSTLWAEPGSNRPMRWVIVTKLGEMETTSTTDYVYDPAIRIVAPVIRNVIRPIVGR
jgi:hypothetical protein